MVISWQSSAHLILLVLTRAHTTHMVMQLLGAASRVAKIVYESAINDSVGPVYLHCWNGWHASGYISALILKQFCGMSDIEATAYWDLGTDGANTSPRYNSCSIANP